MTKSMKFMITNMQYLEIRPELISKDDCAVCAHCDIDYVNDANSLRIRFGYDHTSSACYTIAQSGIIQKLINNEMMIDSSITDDLGFECNQYFAGVKIKSIVVKYLFFSNNHKGVRPYYNGWLYNDKDGNVIFEITPFYPWHRETKKACPEKIPYKKWIQDYKPTLKTIISKENLEQWILQALELKKSLGLHKD